jgi:D-glycero-D-manno-heptose 1,7-bisphosphate phosphatase
MMSPALFLDRDGVINIDYGYVHRPADFNFIDGIFDLCRTAKARGYLLIVVTNQAGIGRGYYTEQQFHTLTDWMRAQFAEQDAVLDAVYFCPTHLEHGKGTYKLDSQFRKPGPGMILQAAQEHDVDLTNSVLVGDKESDIEAGLAAGVGCNILFSPAGIACSQKTSAKRVVRSLISVIDCMN